MAWLTDPQAWLALVTLTAMEIVLGVDNIIFISLMTGKLPRAQQAQGRTLGLAGAMVTRLLLLGSLSWVMGLTAPWVSFAGHDLSGRDIILLGGGLFLLGKATLEIHDKLEGDEGEESTRAAASLLATIVQIMILDIVFSLDSVITAIGMSDHLPVMMLAIVIAVGFMMWSSRSVSDFVHHHPTVKILALSFLLLIGVALIADGLHQHIPKGYLYFAMAFSVFVEMLNLRVRRTGAPVELHERYPSDSARHSGPTS
ncbi:MAG: TerC family protein [Deltaproteobacteria bacterium]|nr:TerC family protein [Deltaproteobacteria bacterium]